jgi:hypothetical protein
MTFDGTIATFEGGVLGYQEDSSIKCDSMQAIMDRRVVFKESQKANEGAKIERLLCDRRVYVVDDQIGLDGKRKQASILECHQLFVDNLYGPTKASGPGRLRHLALSDSDNGAPEPGKPAVAKGANAKGAAGKPAEAKAAQAKEMKLTRIDFRGWMHSNSKAKLKNAIFRDGVEVFNVPSEVFEVPLDRDRLPKGGFYLKCETLNVNTKEVGDKVMQDMVATQRVFFRNLQFYGTCDTLKFDEANDHIIFEADEGNQVQLFELGAGGKVIREIKGAKVLYYRSSGQFKVEKVGIIRSSWLHVPRPVTAWLTADCEDRGWMIEDRRL